MDEGVLVQPICGFAARGTYGHECGRPAVVIAVFESERTMDGLFYAARCAKCAMCRGGDNTGMLRTEPIGEQRNRWRR